ncbi:MAG: hypothetical protein D3926_09705 [Desulfobacteraceae bacterium]|nr:MAG: hypothetical protein D3926_09705 [Desulfobacteraceae bacterium]
MKAENFQEVYLKDFPQNDFFDHLKKGTGFYQKNNFGRAIEEFTEAGLVYSFFPVGSEWISGKISYKGHIQMIPFLYLLYIIQSKQLSGVGILQYQTQKRKFIFQHGLLVRAASADRKDRIGNYLIRKDAMTAQELDEHDREAKKMRKRIGTYLVSKKLISQKTLNELLALQTEEIYSRAMLWKDGYFFFKEMETKEHPCVNYTPLKMALNSSVRGFHFKDFRKEIPNNKIIFKPTSHAAKDKEKIMNQLDANDQFIFYLVDGTRNIEQLIQFSGNDEMSVINMLYKLCSLGLVRKTKEIREYEDKAFNEVQMILGVLFDIYYIVVNELTEELGKHGREMIRATQSALGEEHGIIFNNIDLENRESMQVNTILKNISVHFPYAQKRYLFIDAFLEVFRNSLAELKKYLGLGLRSKTIRQMKLIIENLERFSINTDLKSYMIKNLRQLIN